jgi:dihydrofolate reductase
MGYNTWKSLPPQGQGQEMAGVEMQGFEIPGQNHLKRRDNLILSKFSNCFDLFRNEQIIKTFASGNDLERFVTKAVKYDEIWVIGGAQVYDYFLSTGKINKCYITYIDCDFECDTFFPELDMSQWTEIERRCEHSVKYDCAVYYVVYVKN